MEPLIVSVSGVRGIVGESLTGAVAENFAKAFATTLGAGTTVVLGRDSRPSGAELGEAITAGLIACGVNVVNLGIATTPGTALMTHALRADGGIVITASHNPGQYNGIKFLQPNGVALTAEMAGELKRVWESGQYAVAAPDAVGTSRDNDETHDRHIKAVLKIIDPDAISRRRFKVVLDSINGAGCIVTPRLLEALGCEVVHINGEATGEFAHVPEPIEANLADLGKVIAENGADVGFAQDPDADRLVLIDETGRFIGEEYTLALGAAWTLRQWIGNLATNLCTSRMIDDLAEAAGVKVFRSPTGEANVVDLMLREGCIFGGEGNGGVIDPRVVAVRDSLVGIAIILQYLADRQCPLSELVAEIPAYCLRKIKLRCPPEVAEKMIDAVRSDFSGRDGVTLDESDGLRIDLPDSWVSVRASNTEPILRIFVEAPNTESTENLLGQVQGLCEEILAKSTAGS